MLPHHEIPPSDSEATALAARLAGHIPTLQTDRLRLRPPTIADFPAYAEIALSPEGRFLIPNQSREDAWFDFTNMTACWILRGHGLWAVEKREDAKLVGFALIGFEPGDHEPELGYMLRPGATGFGFATEAAETAKQFAFETLGFTTLVSTVDHDNAASRRVAQRLCGVRDPEAEKAHDNKILVFRYSAEDG